MFESALRCLALHGRHVVISSAGEPRVSFNLVDFYHNFSRLMGVDSFGLTRQLVRKRSRSMSVYVIENPEYTSASSQKIGGSDPSWGTSFVLLLVRIRPHGLIRRENSYIVERLPLLQRAPVAQLDRAFGYEPKGRRFESFRAHQNE
jgi:hypothetical protein